MRGNSSTPPNLFAPNAAIPNGKKLTGNLRENAKRQSRRTSGLRVFSEQEFFTRAKRKKPLRTQSAQIRIFPPRKPNSETHTLRTRPNLICANASALAPAPCGDAKKDTARITRLARRFFNTPKIYLRRMRQFRTAKNSRSIFGQ
ncbi:MAG: hypothetical protein DBX55_08905 [Verrucomicrobia bacterium]|nr:MAG: hypothetical protein DBX55_08905 [Verrucomicrobiota bacterium]